MAVLVVWLFHKGCLKLKSSFDICQLLLLASKSMSLVDKVAKGGFLIANTYTSRSLSTMQTDEVCMSVFSVSG